MKAFAAFREAFDHHLLESTTERVAEFQSFHRNDDIKLYTDHLQKILSGGKRLRPFICSLGVSHTHQTSWQDHLKPIIGLELFHACCLIHDDIMDRASLRRKEQTMHAFIADSLSLPTNRNNRRRSISEGQAILLGDLLFAWASENLFTVQNFIAISEIKNMMQEVIAGQMLDIQTTANNDASVEEITRKMRHKTAGYTFEKPYRLGLALAGYSNEDINHLSSFTIPLGIGFQIQDDYLDITGNPEKTGKPILSDIREGQHTLFSHAILSSDNDALKNNFRTLFGNMDASHKDLTQLQADILSCNVLQPGINAFTDYFQEAKDLIRSYRTTDEQKERLLHFVQLIEQRTS